MAIKQTKLGPASRPVAAKPAPAAKPVAKALPVKTVSVAAPVKAAVPKPVAPAVVVPPTPTPKVAAPKPAFAAKPQIAAPLPAPPADPSPIEDVVGVSPVVETLATTAPTTKIAELPMRISEVMTDLTKTQAEAKTHMDKAMKSAEEMVSFGQGNLEAVMKSSQIWAAGLQDLGKHFAATAQANMDETMATVKALTSVKSLKEAVDMQTAMAKTAMEKLMAESGKMTDASVKLAEQAMAPITARMTLAAEKFGRTA